MPALTERKKKCSANRCLWQHMLWYGSKYKKNKSIKEHEIKMKMLNFT